VPNDLSLGLAFFAGLASFLSPCVFALVPAYIGYLGGRSVAASRGEEGSNTWRTFSHGLAFVLGFSVIFVFLGLLAGSLGRILINFTEVLVKVGAIVIVIFGLHMTSILRIPFLEYDLRPQSQPDRRRGYVSSAVMGIFFSAGWSPCVGPILGAILTLSFSHGSTLEGGLLLTAYSAGLAIPFLLAATQIGWVTTVLHRYGKIMHYIEIIMGVILIIIGILLFLGRFESLATFGAFFDTFDEVLIGRLLLIGVIAAGLMGLVIAFIARSKGKRFLDWWFIGGGISAVIIIVLYLFGAFNFLNPMLSNSSSPEASLLEADASIEIGELAPDFQLRSLSGKEVKLSDFRGHVVLLNFWATWCTPCGLEMPIFQKRLELLSPGLVVLAVNNNETELEVSDFVDEYGLSFDPLLDPGGKVQDLYQINGYPSTFFVNPDGQIQEIHIGIITEGQLDEYLTAFGFELIDSQTTSLNLVPL
jgi:cytochrome c-type biogenesis protein